MLKIPDFLNFPKSQNGRKWPELADNYSKRSALPQSFSKIFFVSQTQKFMKILQKNYPPPPKKRPFFWGGGVMILNVVFAGFDATCLPTAGEKNLECFFWFCPPQAKKILRVFVLFKKAASYTHFWNLIFSKKTKIKKKTGFVILMKTPCQWDFAVLW